MRFEISRKLRNLRNSRGKQLRVEYIPPEKYVAYICFDEEEAKGGNYAKMEGDVVGGGVRVDQDKDVGKARGIMNAKIKVKVKVKVKGNKVAS